MNTFFYDDDIHQNKMYRNVVLNTRNRPLSELGIYAGRFWESGKRLRETYFSGSGGYNDVDACPVIFMYRHSIELYLKAIAIESIELRRLTGEEIDRKNELQRILAGAKKRNNSHSLDRLAKELRRALDLIEQEWSLDVPRLYTFDDACRVLSELDSLDAGSFSFRYPVQKDGQDGSLPPHTTICIECFCALADALLHMLEGILEQARVRIEERRMASDDLPSISDYMSDD